MSNLRSMRRSRECIDFARILHPTDIRGGARRNWIVSFALQDVSSIERRRPNTDANLPESGLRGWSIKYLEHFRAAGAGNDDRSHSVGKYSNPKKKKPARSSRLLLKL